MSARTLIVEDEPKAQKHLRNLLQNSGVAVTIVACLESVHNTISWLKSNPMPDLILMDIHLSDGLSFEILDDIVISVPIIFTTSYDQYAIRAFKTSGIDYLLKPITQESMNAAVAKFYQLKNEAHIDWALKNLDVLQGYRNKDKVPYKKRFLMKTGDTLVPVPTVDIAYFFRQEIVFAKTFKGEMFPIDSSLGHLQTQLDPDQFIRLNRQILANVDAISRLKSSKPGQLVLELNPEYHEKIEMSQERSSWIKQFLDSDT